MAGFEELQGTTEEISDSRQGIEQSINQIENLLGGSQIPEEDDEPAEQEELEGREADDDGEIIDEDVPPGLEADDEQDDDIEYEDVYTVIVNGEEVEVTLDELQAGYRQQSDYTRKTQELADERRAFETQRQETEQAREQYKQLVAALGERLKSFAGQEPDWERLANEDPAGYVQARAAWDRHLAQVQTVEREQQRLQQEDQQKAQQRFGEYVNYQKQALLTAKPELKEADKAQKFFADLNGYAKSFGFTDQELSTMLDHRLLLLAEKAMMFDRSQAKGKTVQKRVKKRPVQLKPGQAKGRSATQTARSRKAHAKLRQTGSVDDAANLIEQLL